MLHIQQDLSDSELWDEAEGVFLVVPKIDLYLEHSLLSISKWEEEFLKPFISEKPKTDEEFEYYIKCMDLDYQLRNIDKDKELYLSARLFNGDAINKYIESSRTATTIKRTGPTGKRVITSELIYYWMTAFRIPTEYETWNYSRLMTLIEICNIEGSSDKKMSSTETMQRQKRLNEERRRQAETKGK